MPVINYDMIFFCKFLFFIFLFSLAVFCKRLLSSTLLSIVRWLAHCAAYLCGRLHQWLSLPAVGAWYRLLPWLSYPIPQFLFCWWFAGSSSSFYCLWLLDHLIIIILACWLPAFFRKHRDPNHCVTIKKLFCYPISLNCRNN